MKNQRRCCDDQSRIVITGALPFQRKPTLMAPRESPRKCRYIFQTILSSTSDGGGVRDRLHRVLVGSTSDRVARLSHAQATGELAKELRRLRCFPMLVIDEVGYLTSSRTLQSSSSNSSRRALSTHAHLGEQSPIHGLGNCIWRLGRRRCHARSLSRPD
jgi:hypothetical protein